MPLNNDNNRANQLNPQHAVYYLSRGFAVAAAAIAAAAATVRNQQREKKK